MTLQRNLCYQGLYVLVIELVVLMGRRGVFHRAPFFNTSAATPCGHRLEAAIGPMNSNSNSGLAEGHEHGCMAASLHFYSRFLSLDK